MGLNDVCKAFGGTTAIAQEAVVSGDDYPARTGRKTTTAAGRRYDVRALLTRAQLLDVVAEFEGVRYGGSITLDDPLDGTAQTARYSPGTFTYTAVGADTFFLTASLDLIRNPQP